MDVLASGPQRPHRARMAPAARAARSVPAARSARAIRAAVLARLRGGASPAGTLRKRGALVVVVLVAAASAVVALRAAELAPPAGRARSAEPRPGPETQILPRPPFDRAPGRTPIPAPIQAGRSLRGSLPPVSGPGRVAALASAQLVLGSYCWQPERYTLTLAPEPGWRRVGVLAFGLDRSGAPPAIRLLLSWTGRAYEWDGSTVQLSVC